MRANMRTDVQKSNQPLSLREIEGYVVQRNIDFQRIPARLAPLKALFLARPRILPHLTSRSRDPIPAKSGRFNRSSPSPGCHASSPSINNSTISLPS